ncbi:MAG: recombinase family protein [Rhizobacter sp.]|nr:recombinase family protein [Ferruginibacter sp.]
MKQVTYLYIRVSTDEQADKGYSQINQDEMLRKFCSINNIDVRKAIFEDHSAKTFNRPRWKEKFDQLNKSVKDEEKAYKIKLSELQKKIDTIEEKYFALKKITNTMKKSLKSPDAYNH